MTFHNKLERLSLASIHSLVLCLWVRPGAYPIVEHLKGASLQLELERLLWKVVTHGRKSFYNIGPSPRNGDR